MDPNNTQKSGTESPDFKSWESLDAQISSSTWFSNVLSRIPEDKVLSAMAIGFLGYALFQGITPQSLLAWPGTVTVAVVATAMVVLALTS